MEIQIIHTWNGEKVDNGEIVSLEFTFGREVKIVVDAPFHGDRSPEAPMGPTPGLWDYEVVELFLLGKDSRYLEIELGPHGHYLVLQLEGVRNIVKKRMPIRYESAICGQRWRGIAYVPLAYLPSNPDKLNAYAIHGEGEGRRYLAAFPTGGEAPDFHRLESFAKIDRSEIDNLSRARKKTLLDKDSLAHLFKAMEEMESGFDLQPLDRDEIDALRLEQVLLEVAKRLQDNFPYFHPLYAGQMLKPPHPIARLAYTLAMSINPNNHALDGGRASSRMEKEAVAEIAAMFGWNTHLGHLCGGGTMANLEALWVSGQLDLGSKIVASEQAHYTHPRMSAILGRPFEAIACDRSGRMELNALQKCLDAGGVGTVVATAGTTATGSVDPLPGLLALKKKYGFHLHVDAAYGGYFCLTSNLRKETFSSFAGIGEADSLVIDPHKHGLQPYGCGCVLFKDPSLGRFYKHDSPYTYFTSQELHLGEISLECSRPGASAVALWATLRMFPLQKGGEFAQGLEKGHIAAMELFHRLDSDVRFLTAFPPELDIVVWAMRSKKASLSSVLAQRVFENAARQGLHLALVRLPVEFFDLERGGMERDCGTLMCLRSVLMKSEHMEWLDEIWNILDRSAV